MKLTVNGEVLILNEGEISLNVWLKDQENTTETFAHAIIEYNGEIIPQEHWDQILLKEGDALEIFKFVGGGR